MFSVSSLKALYSPLILLVNASVLSIKHNFLTTDGQQLFGDIYCCITAINSSISCLLLIFAPALLYVICPFVPPLHLTCLRWICVRRMELMERIFSKNQHSIKLEKIKKALRVISSDFEFFTCKCSQGVHVTKCDTFEPINDLKCESKSHIVRFESWLHSHYHACMVP